MLEEILGNKIRELRKNHDITQSVLSKEIGVTETTISKWENGNATPDIEMLCKISDYFDISLDDLVNRNMELEKKLTNWREKNLNKTSFSSETKQLEFIIGVDDLLIQLMLKRMNMEDVINVVYGSSFMVCEQILSNMSIKAAGFVIDAMNNVQPDKKQIIESQVMAVSIIKDIRQRVEKC